MAILTSGISISPSLPLQELTHSLGVCVGVVPLCPDYALELVHSTLSTDRFIYVLFTTQSHIVHPNGSVKDICPFYIYLHYNNVNLAY